MTEVGCDARQELHTMHKNIKTKDLQDRAVMDVIENKWVAEIVQRKIAQRIQNTGLKFTV